MKSKSSLLSKKRLYQLAFLAILIALYFVLTPNQDENAEQAETEMVQVSKVIDGDTFRAGKRKIRLIGINCPETNPSSSRGVEYMGKEAKDFTRRQILHKKIKIEYDIEKFDQYGRTLAYAYLEDGRMLNEVLLQNGLAHVYTFEPNTAYLSVFEKAEREAQAKNLGIWTND